MKITGINHVTLLVNNKTESEKFFTEVLGLEKYDAGGRLWLKIGKQFLHITNNSGDSKRGNFYHFAIEVENVVDCVKAIALKGISIFDLDSTQKKILVNSDYDMPMRQFFLEDPDGNLIELIDTKNTFFVPVK